MTCLSASLSRKVSFALTKYSKVSFGESFYEASTFGSISINISTGTSNVRANLARRIIRFFRGFSYSILGLIGTNTRCFSTGVNEEEENSPIYSV